ncbi:hypothetical protein [Microcystis sp. M061S2]|uniref:hypothetical protein n=1 Tax=Microcystis sp. M061S2 TaxID=2771171 RepID=UPI00258F086B|nr:hypothetical protein [Microcystis sp. M061S2]MCA2655939.1 hypothetical protein [Microcystis sp. M061S2]
MSDIETIDVEVETIEGLTDGANLVEDYEKTQKYLNAGEIGEAANTLHIALEKLSASNRFWKSADTLVRKCPLDKVREGMKNIGEPNFLAFEHELVTGMHPVIYPGHTLPNALAIDFINRVQIQPSSEITLENFGTETRGNIERLSSQIKEHANAQSSSNLSDTGLILRHEDNSFGILIKGIGRALLAVAGAGVAGVNAYVVVSCFDVSIPALGSMFGGLGAIGSAVFDDPSLIRQDKAPADNEVPQRTSGTSRDYARGIALIGGIQLPIRK